jgi:hypothetical protein
MPFKTTREPHGLLTDWWGHSTNAEMVQMQEKAHCHPDFNSVRYSIHDFSKCENFEPSSCDVEFSAAIDGAASRTSKRLKIAIVAANAGVSEMVSRYIDLGLSPYQVKFFASLQEAREWAN